MVAEVHVVLFPLVEVLLRGDGAPNPLFGAHRPVLHESPRALDGRLVDALTGVDGEGPLTVDGKVAFLGPRLVGCQLGVAVEDVVLCFD